MPSRIGTALASGERCSEALVADLRETLAGASPGLVLLFASPAYPLAALAADVRDAFEGALVLSASSAGEFTDRGDAHGAAAALAVAGDFQIAAGLGVGLAGDVDGAVERALAGLPPRRATHPFRTAIVAVDALAGVSDQATARLVERLGRDVQIVGAAAGDDLAMARTVVGVGAQVATDSIAVAVVDARAPFGVGASHAHRPLSCALRVTRAEGARVFEIEHRPAWDVWLAHTRAHAQRQGIDVDGIAAQDEGGFLLRYEAALVLVGESPIRAPLARGADGSIRFACPVPQGTLLRITESGPGRQMGVAREAARLAREAVSGRPLAGALVFDCVCRKLILDDAFGTAIRAMSDELGPVPFAGFETYGEIAVSPGPLRGFYNTTSVVLAIPA